MPEFQRPEGHNVEVVKMKVERGTARALRRKDMHSFRNAQRLRHAIEAQSTISYNLCGGNRPAIRDKKETRVRIVRDGVLCIYDDGITGAGEVCEFRPIVARLRLN
jgi:hypothetical protein